MMYPIYAGLPISVKLDRFSSLKVVLKKTLCLWGKSPAATEEATELDNSAQNHTKLPCVALFSATQLLEETTT